MLKNWRFALAIFLAALVMAGEGMGAIDKSGDAALQKMLSDVAPKFAQNEFKSGDKILRYNLFVPEAAARGEKQPLVLFMADASTPGADISAPLKQGYGAPIWATAEAQAKHPCYVLVPQFSDRAVNDAWQKTAEVDLIVPLLRELAKTANVDPDRIYATGQSMGGMIAMYLNVAWPGEFAASLFVDSHWDPASFGELVKQNFIFMAAGDEGKGFADIKPLEEAAEKGGRSYTFASWSARLPLKTQEDVAQTMLDKGAPINFFEFEPGTVVPEGVKGSEHMYSFDCAYRLAPLRDWLFRYKRAD